MQDILTTSGTSLTDINALASGAAPVALPACALVLVLRKGGTWRRAADDWRLHANDDGARAWRKNGATRVLAAIDARMGEFTGPNISVMKTVSGMVKKPSRTQTRTGS